MVVQLLFLFVRLNVYGMYYKDKLLILRINFPIIKLIEVEDNQLVYNSQ